MDPVVLRTERLVLSVTTADDVDAITRLCQDREMVEMLAALPWPYTRADAEFFVNDIVAAGWASGDALTWSIREREGGPHLGSIGWRRATHDIGYWMGAPFRERGYAVEAVREVCRWVFAELGEERIGWEALVGNVASARVARAAGFSFDGTRESAVCVRDGGPPPAWHAFLRHHDDGTLRQGWPL
jgi:RimJ/RimL family protein N-acetyltransferase